MGILSRLTGKFSRELPGKVFGSAFLCTPVIILVQSLPGWRRLHICRITCCGYQSWRGREGNVAREAGRITGVVHHAEDLNDPHRFKNMPQEWRPWKLIAGNSFKHYENHMPSLREWLAKKR